MRISNRYSLSGAAASLALLHAAPLHAQYSEEELNKWKGRYSENIAWNYENVILANLDRTQRARAKEMSLHFVLRSSAPFPLSVTNATALGTRLQVSVEAIKLFDDLSVAVAWLSSNRQKSETVPEYVSFLRQERTDGVRQGIPQPWPVLGIPPDALKSSRVDDVAQKLLKSAVLFDVAHELGHILFESPAQRPATERNLRTELQADRFAVDIFRRIGVLPAGVGLWVSMSNRWFGGRSDGVEHPVSSERWTALASVLAARSGDFFRFEEKPLDDLLNYLVQFIRGEASYAYLCYELEGLFQSDRPLKVEQLRRRPIEDQRYAWGCY